MEMLAVDVRKKIRKELVAFKKAETEKEKSIMAWKLFLFCLKIERRDIMIKEDFDASLQEAINFVLDEFSEYDLIFPRESGHNGERMVG